MLPCLIREDDAVERAVAFLRQHFSVINTEKPVFKGDSWLVEVTVSEPMQKKFKIKVNPKTGHIMGF